MQKGRKKFCCFILALALVLAGTGMAGTSALAEAADERKEEKNFLKILQERRKMLTFAAAKTGD